MLPTDKLARKSFMGVQVAGEAVMSVVFHSPPSTPPIQTVLLVASARSTQIALIRPLVAAVPLGPRGFPLEGPVRSLLGPRSVQVNAVVRREGFFFSALLSVISFSEAVIR